MERAVLVVSVEALFTPTLWLTAVCSCAAKPAVPLSDEDAMLETFKDCVLLCVKPADNEDCPDTVPL